MHVKAVLIASGDRDRLRPLTTNIPTPLLPIANRPVMTYAIELLIRHDIRHILVTLHHLPAQIETFFKSGRRWGAKLEYHLQRDPLGTAVALKRLQSELSSTFIVINADTVIDLDITQALKQHSQRKSIATVIMHANSSHLSSKNGHQTKPIFSNNGTNSWQSTHTYIFEPEIFDHIQSGQPPEPESGLLNQLTAAGLPIHTYNMQGYYNPLDSFQQYQAAQITLLNKHAINQTDEQTETAIRYLSTPNKKIKPGIWVHPKSSVHPTAQLIAPVSIAENCHISNDVIIGPEVVLGADVFVAPEATIHHSTILKNTYLGQLVHVENRVVHKNLIVDIPTGEYSYITDHFLLGTTQDTTDETLRRLFDITLATIGLILAMPLLILLSLIVLISSGKAFHKVERRKRPTLDATAVSTNHFHLFHLNIYTPQNRFQLLQKLIYRCEFHRLPELWNILQGELSFIGSKPLSPANVAQLTDKWQMTQNNSQPGFTGLWYILTDPTSHLDEIIITDAYFQATRSWTQDIKIALKTPLIWTKRNLLNKGKLNAN